MYGGLYYFLHRNLVSRAQANVLFIAIVIFETGMTTLVYTRTLFLLPAFVVYLNNLTADKKGLGGNPAIRVALPDADCDVPHEPRRHQDHDAA